MYYELERKVHAAAIAGWWALLGAVVFLTAVWLAFLSLVSARPDWMLSLWGPGITWEMIENVTLWAVAFFKVAVWLMAIVVLWLTLWARELRKLVH